MEISWLKFDHLSSPPTKLPYHQMTFTITLIHILESAYVKYKKIVRGCYLGVKLLKYYVYQPFDIHLRSSKQRSREYLMLKSVLKC